MIYGYMCNSCKKLFTTDWTISEKEKILKVICSHCNSYDVKRVYDVPAVIYKGAGFTKSLNKE